MSFSEAELHLMERALLKYVEFERELLASVPAHSPLRDPVERRLHELMALHAKIAAACA